MNKLTTALVVALSVLPTVPALAQVQSSSATTSSAGAPVFSIQNFQGDARQGDLYYYMHPQQFPQWDEYRRKLQADAQKIQDQQPTQQNPSPQTLANSGQSAVTQMNSIAASATNGAQNAATTSASTVQQQPAVQQTQQQVSTDVQGTVLTPGVSVPGLVDP